MKNFKNQAPIYVEAQIVNEEQKIIPQDFVELTTQGKNYMCSTEGWKEPICERYGFAYENGKKWITLDIPQNLMGKLGLEPGKNCSDLIFISPEVLKREPECGGITLKNEKEIFLAPHESKLVREKGVQTKLTSEEIKELEEELKELEIKSTDLEKLKNVWRNKYLEEKESKGQEFRDQINELTQERGNIQRKLDKQQIEVDNLQNEIKRLNNNLQTTQQEKDRIKDNLQTQLRQSQNERDNLQTQVNQLTNQINNLSNERNDYQTKWDNSTEELEQKREMIRDYLQRIKQLEREKEELNNDWQNRHQQEINQKDSEISRLEVKVEGTEKERDNRPDITFHQWDSDYRQRPTQQQLTQIQNQLVSTQQQLNNLQSELDRTRTELNNTKKERDYYCNQWNNHTCPTCDEHHCFGDCHYCLSNDPKYF